ncbi:MAG: MFS transporter, partial [Candidatus Bathyarchaeia archaeon]
AYGLGGVGVGIFYATSIGTAIKWFPDRRGLATGLVSCGYGFGATVFNPIISNIINTSGFRTALLHLGLGMLATLVVAGFLIVFPPSGWTLQILVPKKGAAAKIRETAYQYGVREMVSTRQWWQIYLAFVFTANLGLMD